MLILREREKMSILAKEDAYARRLWTRYTAAYTAVGRDQNELASKTRYLRDKMSDLLDLLERDDLRSVNTMGEVQTAGLVVDRCCIRLACELDRVEVLAGLCREYMRQGNLVESFTASE